MPCPICDKTDVLRCPICRKPIELHSHEWDYMCDVHSFVNPVRDSDGAVVDGSGLGFDLAGERRRARVAYV